MNLSEPMTPATLSNDGKTLIIPIYQRLFVWGEDQIGNLLNDLQESCYKDKSKDYHLGVITIHEDEKQQWEIVDGQQRLTFLTLLGCELIRACKKSNATWANCWNKFVLDEEKKQLRIFFNGRDEDREDIQNVLNINATFKNPSFERFSECFRRFTYSLGDDILDDFSTYCFNHAAFLVNELPRGYGAEELNLHFEKMNSTGRQLSPLEVVKGKWFAPLASRWNRCMNFDKEFTLEQAGDAEIERGEGLNLKDVLDKTDKYIRVIGAEKKVENDTPSQSRLVMKPEILALHALCCLCKKKNVASPSIQRQALIEAFQMVFKNPTDGLTPDAYITELENYRFWVDKHIVFIQDAEGDLDYEFRKNAEKDEKDMNLMKQFQTMLHVSSGEAQEWVLKAYFESKHGALSYDTLRMMENKWHKLAMNSLGYGKVSRYWFWKLDYLLWELHQKDKNNKTFDELKLEECEHEAISNYRFRENISIEHLHPQSKGDGEWGRRDNPDSPMHRFGNLAMMSQSGNSAQSDDGIGTKFGRVTDWIRAGRLESIKMLLMFRLADKTAEGWTVKKAGEHEEKMINILKSDYEHQRQSNEQTET